MLLRLLAMLLFGALLAGCPRRETKNPLLIAPTFAAQELQKAKRAGLLKSLYWNNSARSWVQTEQLVELAPDERAGTSPRMRAFFQAAQDPQVFRRLDREERFDTIWLLGDPSGFKPLVEHLRETKDFGLVWLDHTSLIFRRGEGARWDPGQLELLRDQFPSRTDRAKFLADAATRLIAVHEMESAGRLLSEAEKLDQRVAAVWSGRATYELARGDLSAAGAAADRALSLDRSFLPAMACKTQVLFGTKQFTEAFRLSTELLARAPDDPGLLFYHAKLAHQAHAFEAEISTLRHLIKLAQAAGASVSGYRVYLGQAHAANGDADEALDQLSLALLDTELPREQRLFADQLFLQIKDRVGLPGDPKK